MEALTANEAKTQFGDLLLKAQQAPVQINKNGKPVAVVISISEYEHMEDLKMRVLLARAEAARGHIANRDTVDGELFFDELDSGAHDTSA
jgi:prevent-host-death family protein